FPHQIDRWLPFPGAYSPSAAAAAKGIPIYVCPSAGFGVTMTPCRKGSADLPCMPISQTFGTSTYIGSAGIAEVRQDAVGNQVTHYVGGMFSQNSAVAFRDVMDGESYTMLLSESLIGF